MSGNNPGLKNTFVTNNNNKILGPGLFSLTFKCVNMKVDLGFNKRVLKVHLHLDLESKFTKLHLH